MIRSDWSSTFRVLDEFTNWPGRGMFVARDKHLGGKITKEYNWVESWESVQNTIEVLEPSERNFHELHTDHTPVKLYFDFELDGTYTNEAVHQKIRDIINRSIEVLGRNDITPVDFAILNSSYVVDGAVRRYSYHIVLTRGVYFQTGSLLKEFVRTHFDESYGICLGVYGSNRLLRMPSCTKLGENRPLIIETPHSFSDCLITYCPNE